jgi:hypothetical protein
METTEFAGFLIIMGPGKPMNPLFPKLPRNYAVDAVWSRLFFSEKTESGTVGDSEVAWNIGMTGNARL